MCSCDTKMSKNWNRLMCVLHKLQKFSKGIRVWRGDNLIYFILVSENSLITWIMKRIIKNFIDNLYVYIYIHTFSKVLFPGDWPTEFCYLYTTKCQDLLSSDFNTTVIPVRGTLWDPSLERTEKNRRPPPTSRNNKEPNVEILRLDTEIVVHRRRKHLSVTEYFEVRITYILSRMTSYWSRID